MITLAIPHFCFPCTYKKDESLIIDVFYLKKTVYIHIYIHITLSVEFLYSSLKRQINKTSMKYYKVNAYVCDYAKDVFNITEKPTLIPMKYLVKHSNDYLFIIDH